MNPGELTTENIYRILVLRPNHRLGNVLMLTPLISELERKFPGAEIDLLIAGQAGREVFSTFVSVRRIHALPHYGARHLIQLARAIVGLRRYTYDLIIDPCVDSNSNRLFIAALKSRFALGVPSPYSDAHGAWEGLLSRAPKHMATFPVFLLRHALAQSRAVDERHYPGLDLRLSTLERAAGRHVLSALIGNRDGRRMTIGIFANATGAKRYEQSWWLRFIDVIVAEPKNYTIVEIVAADARSRLDAAFPAYYSTDARKLAALISNLDCFVSADCGLMHLSCASGAPTIGLFSVTDISKYAPYGRNNCALETTGRTAGEVALSALETIRKITPRITSTTLRERRVHSDNIIGQPRPTVALTPQALAGYSK